MTARPKDWSPLYDSDPVPGDPYEIAKLGKKLRGMADEIDKQARNIRALASVEEWDSDAGRAFHEIAGDTAGRLKQVYDRYDGAASAVGTKVREDGGESDEYASELHRAQRLADRGLQEYREHEADYKAAGKILDPNRGKVLTGDDAVEHSKQQKKQDDASELMTQAAKKIMQATVIRNEAASRASRRIKNVIWHDKIHDPGGIMNWLADHADWISTAATIVGALALLAAVVLSGGTLAVLLIAMASALSATALTARLYDVFARGGKIDYLAIGMDALGIFPGLGALKGLKAAKGLRLLAAREGIWTAFTNGFAVKNINKGVTMASKILSKRGINLLPEAGFEPEVLTRFIKGGAVANLGVQLGIAAFGGEGGDDKATAPSGKQPQPSPSPGPTPRPSSSAPPSMPKAAQPSPTSTSFHAALAPVG
ncbi:putative T7SS-secreted protein [Streptomyces sp. NPDC006654]|uniref:putative T7SS-secreted protein n=1 Tax=Streptomyces sp. NPDC006654 TaxID=3156897 RepID=UPI0033E0D52B